MSCANAICASTHQEESTPASIPSLWWPWRFPLRLLAAKAGCFERRCERREILELDDRLLADIGLTRQDVSDGAVTSCYARVATWHAYR
jgi:uncharacterized protein YjiS (DUF1127 family)